MQIERSIHFKAIVSDRLFFELLRCGLDSDADDDTVITHFPFTNPGQVGEQIETFDSLYEWSDLLSAVRTQAHIGDGKPLLISSIEIRPEHPAFNWYFVDVYDTLSFEEWMERFNV